MTRSFHYLQLLFLCLIAWGLGSSLSRGAPPNPYPSPVHLIADAEEWRFPADAASWRAHRDCSFSPNADQYSSVVSSGVDPILVRPVEPLDVRVMIEIECRAVVATTSQLFWTQSPQMHFSEALSQRFDLLGDNQFHTYRIPIDIPKLRALRWDPADAPVTVDVRSIRVQPYAPSELELTQVQWIDDSQLQVTVRNTSPSLLTTTVSAESAQSDRAAVQSTVDISADGESTVVLELPPANGTAELIHVRAASQSAAALRPTLRNNRLNAMTKLPTSTVPLPDWPSLSSQDRTVWVAPDGTCAIITAFDPATGLHRTVAHLTPLAWDRQTLETFDVQRRGDRLVAETNGLTVELLWDGADLVTHIDSSDEVEGPVVCVPGIIEQGLLAGVEHLGQAEASSSDIDIQTNDRFRFEPQPHHLTMQLAAVVTDRDVIAVSWSNSALQPVFAIPNFYEGTSDSRLALKGKRYATRLCFSPGWSAGGTLEDSILHFIQRQGLPALPAPARSDSDQDALDHDGLIRSELYAPGQGWFHAILPGGQGSPDRPRWFGDHVSTLLALNQTLPVDLSVIARGGSHIINDRWMLLMGQAEQWAKSQQHLAETFEQRVQADGAVIYDGPWAEGHFENTSSGQCGLVAEQLLTIAWRTGNRQALQTGLRVLNYCQKFRTPRGAQVWECPLHAPDIMAAAHLLRSHVLAAKLTGDRAHQQHAVRWALSGLPFVYQWGVNDTMLYATTPTLCATHRIAPLWIGRPVQWCGIVYADALLDLAELDQTIDWRQLAEGIYRSATYQQYQDGPSRGLLPDSIAPTTLRRFPLDINPDTLVQVGHRLREAPVNLFTVQIDGHAITSPWPIAVTEQAVEVRSPSAVEFQIVVDGQVQPASNQVRLQRPLR